MTPTSPPVNTLSVHIHPKGLAYIKPCMHINRIRLLSDGYRVWYIVNQLFHPLVATVIAPYIDYFDFELV